MTQQPETSYDSAFRLFYTGELALPTGDTRAVVLRSIGRLDAKKRRDYARQQANYARRHLQDETDPEAVEVGDSIAEMTDDELARIVQEWFRARLAREAVDNVYIREDESDDLPEAETLVESLEEDDRIEDAKKTLAKLRADYVIENLPRRTDNILADRERAEDFARKLIVESMVLDVHQAAWTTATLYYGVLNPDGTRFFRDMPVDIDDTLASALAKMYRVIDEGSYRPSS